MRPGTHKTSGCPSGCPLGSQFFLEAGLRRVRNKQDSVRHQVEELYRQGEQLKADFVPLLKPVGIDLEEEHRKCGCPKRLVDGPSRPAPRGRGAGEKRRELKQHRWLSTPRQALLFLACFAAGEAPALILEPWLFWLAAGLIAGPGLAWCKDNS